MDGLVGAALVAARLLPSLWLVPPLGGHRVPVPARIALALALGWALRPPPDAPLPELWWLRLPLELAVGSALAVAAAGIFMGARLAGEWVDAMSQRPGGATVGLDGESASPLGALELLLACGLFFACGGPELFLGQFAESLRRLPPGQWPAPADAAEAARLVLDGTAGALRAGAALAFPAAGASFLLEGVLAFAGRAAPQMPVYFVGLPLRALLGALMLALTLDGTLSLFLRGA